MIRYILCDIEGTTTPISFVHEVLFPYSYEHLPKFVADNNYLPQVNSCIKDTIATMASETASETVKEIDEKAAIQTLLDWIKSDRKHPALKTLQGIIWKSGYETGAFTSAIYDDVIPRFRSWNERHLRVGIYSSGSTQAQKLLFRHTPAGDLTPLLSNYFDTGIGPKKNVESYLNISNALTLRPESILFLSDIEAELTAAVTAGFHAIQLVRPGTKAAANFKICGDFYEVDSWIISMNSHTS